MTTTKTTLVRQLIQTLFWSAWIGLFLLAAAQSQPLNSGFILISVTVGLGCWVMSELLRVLALRRSWLELSAFRLGSRLVLALTLLSLSVQALVYLVLMPSWHLGWVELPASGPDYRPGMILVYWFNTLFMLGVWLAAWLFIELRERHRRLERQRFEDRLEYEVQRRVLELDGLRSRLNPHFVFNALNNVRALINEDTERARELVTRLSNTLRYALYHTQEDSVTLEQELAVVNDYLAIEQVHYEDRLQVMRRIAPEAVPARLPPMLLQLLVENAIKHGIAQTASAGELQLSAWLDHGDLWLSVSNPGKLDCKKKGVGLAYLRARLIAWSPRAEFDIAEQGGGVRAQLSLPQQDDRTQEQN